MQVHRVGGRAVALLIVAVMGAVPVALAAQARPTAPASRPVPATASRLWYEVTLGGSGARLSCGICSAHRDVGAALTGAVGAYASPTLRVGLELSRWTYRDAGVREHTSGVGVALHYTPDPRGRIYLLGGAGWTTYRASDYRYDAPRLTVGMGYDVPAFGRVVFGNVVAMDLAAFGRLRNGAIPIAENVGMSAVRVALQVRRR